MNCMKLDCTKLPLTGGKCCYIHNTPDRTCEVESCSAPLATSRILCSGHDKIFIKLTLQRKGLLLTFLRLYHICARNIEGI